MNRHTFIVLATMLLLFTGCGAFMDRLTNALLL